MTDTHPLLELKDGTRLDPAVAFVFVHGLRKLLAKSPDEFRALYAIVTGEGRDEVKPFLVARLQREGFVDARGEVIPDLGKVLRLAIETDPCGKLDVGLPFHEFDKSQMALWADQQLNQWQVFSKFRPRPGGNTGHAPTS